MGCQVGSSTHPTTSDQPAGHAALRLPKLPGIVALLNGFPESGAALRQLAEVLLRAKASSLTMLEREVIAAVVSRHNHCAFCYRSHRAAALTHATSEQERSEVLRVCEGESAAGPRLRVLLGIAELVRNHQPIPPVVIADARSAGVDDRGIHDAALLASAFCMFNRYVTALHPDEASEAEYAAMGKRMAEVGYINPSQRPDARMEQKG